MKITCLGHASFLIEAGGKKIYIDPYSLKERGAADLILITHDHYDHCDTDAIRRIKKPGTHILGSACAKKKVPQIGVLRIGDKAGFEDIKIKAVAAYNLASGYHTKESCLGFLIEAEGKRIYHAGDTDRIPEMAELGDIDVALLPIGGRYTMGVDEAVSAVKTIKPEFAIPIHYGRLGGARYDADRFKLRVEEETESKAEILEKRPLEI